MHCGSQRHVQSGSALARLATVPASRPRPSRPDSPAGAGPSRISTPAPPACCRRAAEIHGLSRRERRVAVPRRRPRPTRRRSRSESSSCSTWERSSSAARTARCASSSCASGTPKAADHRVRPANFSTVPLLRLPMLAETTRSSASRAGVRPSGSAPRDQPGRVDQIGEWTVATLALHRLW